MKSVIAIRHLHFEDLGTLEPLFRERGYEVDYIDATVDDFSFLDTLKFDLLVVLGGPIGAFDESTYPFLSDELGVVHRRLTAKEPILGICLGAQLIARALGAKVYPLGDKEIGFAPLTLTAEGRQSPLAAVGDTPVLHWHGDQFDIPPGAERLASTPIGKNQAFSLGRKVLGLQFHLEADVSHIEQWLVGHASELAQAGIDPRILRVQAQQIGSRLASVSREVVGTWLDGIESQASS